MNSPTQALDINSLDSIAAMLQPTNAQVTGPDTNGEFPSPLAGALWMATTYQALQTPLKGKAPFLSEWQKRASKDPAQIQAWWDEYHCNFGTVGEPGNLFMFETDSPDVRERFGHDFTAGLVIESSGRGREHQYHLSVPGIENVAQSAVKFGDFSIRASAEQCVSPGSVHPRTGKQYRVIRAGPLTPPTPEEMAFWKSETKGKERLNASTDGPPIPRGQHDSELFRLGCLLRNAGMDYEQIKDGLIGICEKRCVDHGADYVDMCEKKAGQAVKYEVGKANPKVVLGKSVSSVEEAADVSNWRSLFSNVSEMQQGEVEMVIAGVLQEDGTFFLGASAGHGKTLLALSLSKSITLGQPLFGMPEFAVKMPRHVIYLMAESSDRAFRKRCEAFGLPKDDRFIARTLTKGLPLALADPGLLEAVRQLRPVVFIDTTSRFNRSGDENSAAANQLLANDVTALRAAGAIAVVLLHHAKKAATREAMTQENMLRGTSDFAAMGDHTYGLRQDEHLYNHGAGPMEIDLVNLKDREHAKGLLSHLRLAATYMKPGALQPTSYIDEMGDFRPVDWAENKDRVRETLNQMVEANPMVSVKELCGATSLNPRKVREMLQSLGWHVTKGGPENRSPWHKDQGKPCPYEEAKKSGKKGVVDFGESEPVFKTPVRVN